jgi:hypothetical protein
VIETRIVSAGALRLDPPGMEIEAAELFALQASTVRPPPRQSFRASARPQ